MVLHDLPSKAEIRAALVAAGCRREYLDTMQNIIFTTVGGGANVDTTIQTWKGLKGWWFE